MELTKEYFDQQLNNLARKEDVDSLKIDVAGLKTDVQSIKEDVMALQDEMRSIKTGVSEIKQTVDELNLRDKEDSDAFAKTLVEHDNRLNTVESDVKNLRLKQA